MDKLAAKQVACENLGREWAIPTLWTGTNPFSIPTFASEIMIKARHGCNQFARIGAHLTIDKRDRILKRARGWKSRPYGVLLNEWAYRDVPRGVLAEPFVSDSDGLPPDYKVYVFGGQATHIQVHLDRLGKHRWVLHDRNWRRLVAGPDSPREPASLLAMLEAAETLAANNDFLRVDFYEIGNRPLFGEFCLYPGSGLDPFPALWIDEELGMLWSDAHRRAQHSPDRRTQKARESKAGTGARFGDTNSASVTT